MILSATDIKQWFKISFTTDDTLLGLFSAAAEAEAEQRIGSKIQSSVVTEYYDGDGTNKLVLKNYPVISISSICDDLDRAYGTDTEISSDDYILYETDGIVKLDGLIFNNGLKNIKVIYNAGRASVPSDIKYAIACLAFAMYLESVGGINVVEGQNIIYKPEKLRTTADNLLQPYKAIR